MLSPTGRSVKTMGPGGLDEAAASEGGICFGCCIWASLNVSGRRVHWGPRVPEPVSGSQAALQFV
jgi:hypothetical protein